MKTMMMFTISYVVATYCDIIIHQATSETVRRVSKIVKAYAKASFKLFICAQCVYVVMLAYWLWPTLEEVNDRYAVAISAPVIAIVGVVLFIVTTAKVYQALRDNIPRRTRPAKTE